MVLRISWLLYTYRLMGRIDIVSTPRMTTWCLLDLIYVLYTYFFMHISHLNILYASSCSLVLTSFFDRQGSLTWLASVLPSGSPGGLDIGQERWSVLMFSFLILAVEVCCSWSHDLSRSCTWRTKKQIEMKMLQICLKVCLWHFCLCLKLLGIKESDCYQNNCLNIVCFKSIFVRLENRSHIFSPWATFWLSDLFFHFLTTKFMWPTNIKWLPVRTCKVVLMLHQDIRMRL